jgi:hypothetical protein
MLEVRNVWILQSDRLAVATSGNGWFSGLGDAFEIYDNSTVSGGNQTGTGCALCPCILNYEQVTRAAIMPTTTMTTTTSPPFSTSMAPTESQSLY